jgi:hypothetical protein
MAFIGRDARKTHFKNCSVAEPWKKRFLEIHGKEEKEMKVLHDFSGLGLMQRMSYDEREKQKKEVWKPVGPVPVRKDLVSQQRVLRNQLFTNCKFLFRTFSSPASPKIGRKNEHQSRRRRIMRIRR